MARFVRQAWLVCALFVMAGAPLLASASNCRSTVGAVFSADGTSVTVQSSKDLSNVVLKYCDGSTNLKYDNLSGLEATFSGGGKTLAGVWIKSGCNASGDGPGYGQFVGTTCPPPRDCMGVPGGQAVVDLCGICGGDNSVCKDCGGTINGGKKLDACGVCGGDGTNCAGCDDVPNSGKVVDVCGVCGGDNSSCLDCNGYPAGGANIDACGKCGGDSTTCLDCAGVPNGPARLDACGVCGGNNAGPCDRITGCNGVLDKCGVCNGNNACLDCAGIPNGGTEIDCCGVCGGDGGTCLDKCKVYKLRGEKRKLIKQITALYKTIRGYSLLQLSCGAKRNQLNDRIALAAKLAKESINLVKRYVADEVKVCDTAYCKKTSFAGVLSAVKRNSVKLAKLARKTQMNESGVSCGPRVNRSGSIAGAQAAREIKSSIRKVPQRQCS